MGGMSAVAAVALGAPDARALTDQIKVGVEAVWELVIRAYDGRADRALGYSSWDDYCTREFGTARLRLPREERAEVVASLRESGLSIRAIASATGTAYNTVLKDVTQFESRGVDADELAEELIAAEPPKVTGLDGKSYKPTSAAPTKPRRGAITDDAGRIGRDLASITRRLNKLLDDDRFSRNREEIGCRIRPYPQHCLDVLERLVREIDGPGDSR